MTAFLASRLGQYLLIGGAIAAAIGLPVTGAPDKVTLAKLGIAA